MKEPEGIARSRNKNVDGDRPTGCIRTFDEDVTRIGTGLLGGTVESLSVAAQAIHRRQASSNRLSGDVVVPHMHVVAADYHDSFLKLNDLSLETLRGATDAEIAAKFSSAALPGRLTGGLGALVERLRTPLAVQASGISETVLYDDAPEPYSSRLLPNCHPEPEIRLRELERAIKAVWASTSFKRAESFLSSRNKTAANEKVAVVIREVFGRKIGNGFCPDISGTIVSPLRTSGYKMERKPIVRAECGLTGRDIPTGFCTGIPADGGPWAVSLNPEHDPSDETASKCRLVSLSRISDGVEFNPSTLAAVPTDELLRIGERIVGGRVALHFASRVQQNGRRSVETAILKLSRAVSF